MPGPSGGDFFTHTVSNVSENCFCDLLKNLLDKTQSRKYEVWKVTLSVRGFLADCIYSNMH